MELWPLLAGTRLFITGATGFYGKWLLEAIIAANDALGTRIRATLLSRNPARFKAEVPHLGLRPEFEWIVGDPTEFEFPTGGFDYLIDFATPSAAEVGAGGTAIVERCLQGSANLIRFAKATGVRRVLYASSGAVYGSQPADVEQLTEDYVADPATVSPYGRLKLRSEALLPESGLDYVITRGFAFIGPYLPLTDKFAAGSFLRDALSGGPIVVRGDGTDVRSYLYATDLAMWLLASLLKGKKGQAYNVGSDEPVRISRLAAHVAALAPGGPAVRILEAPGSRVGSWYVPRINRARTELGLTVLLGLNDAINRTMDWCLAAKNTECAYPL